MKKTLFSIGFILLCAGVLVGYLVYSGDIELLPQAFRWPQCIWLIVGVAAMVLCWLWEAGVLWYMARGLIKPISYRTSLRSTMVVQFFNNVTPFSSGGQPMQIWSLWRDGVPVGESTAIQIGKFAVFQVVLTLCSTAALVYDFPIFKDYLGGWMWMIVIAYIVQVGVLVFVVVLIVKPRFMRWMVDVARRIVGHTRLKERLANLFEKADTELTRFEESSALLRGNLRVFAVGALLTLVQLFFFFSVAYCSCRALDVNPPFLATVAAAAFVYMVAGIVPLPGASGGAEGTFALVFSLFFPEGTSVAVCVFLWRALTFYLPVAVGSFFCIGAKREIPEEAPSA